MKKHKAAGKKSPARKRSSRRTALPKEAENLRRTAAKLAQRSLRIQSQADELHHAVDTVHHQAEAVHGSIRSAKAAAHRRGKLGKPQADGFTIVAVGASAGGLEAITELLKNLGNNPGIALVVTQHLDPSHESSLPALLGRATNMTVHEAKNDAKIQLNRVYVIPPNKAMRIANRKLRITPRRTEKDVRMPIDGLFESLAAEEAERAVGIVLSGNGSDGTRGMMAIKASGGITFAQDEQSAKYPAMPSSAVGAGCVDFVMSPAQIARELVGLVGRPSSEPLPLLPASSKAQGQERAFEEILVLLRQRTGVDFTHYKRPTLDRRIQRRMGLQKTESLREYANHLRSHAPEVQELFNDILIHVTGFFRDPGVFNVLKRKVLPRLIKGRNPDEPIRVWVPGCSSGEEVYSLAMVLVEFLSDHKVHFPIQIFGTDINMQALDRARSGFYPAGIAADVSQERLRRFFTKLDTGFRINKSLRESCVFARQNVVVDPPFSSLDLISCRNLLIYLGPQLQRKVFPVFHYALKPTGFLMLGASETTGPFANLFNLADKKIKIYGKRQTVTRPVVTFGHGVPDGKMEVPPPVTKTPTLEVGPSVPEVQKQADRVVLTHFTPAGVVINRAMEVLQFRGRTGLYLEHSHGEATLNLLKMAREGLAIDLRATINKAMSKNSRARQDGIRVKTNDHYTLVNVEVTPFAVPPSPERFFLVMFQSVDPVEAGKKFSATKGRGASWKADTRELNRLREELAATRESLQAIIEEQEATNEELRSANEEIMSSNEELQSTNEELETAKEELQSTNEELTTLNDELENRNIELENVNNDLHNLLASVSIPIIMVGQDLRIRRFTGVAEKLFNIVPTDVGRPISHIKAKVDLPHLDKVITEVIDSLQTKEIEVKSDANHWWSVRVRPYKTTDHKIDGAVLAFVDIDHQKKSPQKKSPQKK